VYINVEFPDALNRSTVFAVRSAFEKILGGGTRDIARSYLKLAARNFFFQPLDAGFQFMRRQGGNIFAQLDVGQFLARAEIVGVHGLSFPQDAH
jgi:hypothetical protein